MKSYLITKELKTEKEIYEFLLKEEKETPILKEGIKIINNNYDLGFYTESEYHNQIIEEITHFYGGEIKWEIKIESKKVKIEPKEGDKVTWKDGDYIFLEGHWRKESTLAKVVEKIEYKEGEVVTFKDGDYLYSGGKLSKILTIEDILTRNFKVSRGIEYDMKAIIGWFDAKTQISDINTELKSLIEKGIVRKTTKDVGLDKKKSTYRFLREGKVEDTKKAIDQVLNTLNVNEK